MTGLAEMSLCVVAYNIGSNLVAINWHNFVTATKEIAYHKTCSEVAIVTSRPKKVVTSGMING